MKSKYNLTFIPLILLLTYANVGWTQTGANILAISPGARALAMGGAFTGVADDALCTYYNPAGLSFIDGPMTSSTYFKWQFGFYPDIHYTFSSLTFPLGYLMGVGCNIAYLTAGDVVTYRVVTDTQYSEPIDQGMSRDIAFNLNYGFRVLENVAAGIGVKYIHAHHYTCWGPWETGSTFAADFALLYRGRLSFGAVFQNLGNDIIYDETGRKDPLPKILRLGVSYKLFHYRCIWIYTPQLMISAQATKLFYETKLANIKELDDMNWQMGMEYWSYNYALRVGYFYDKYKKNRIKNGITYGIGFSMYGLTLDFAVDSSIHNFPESNYYLTLNCHF